MITELSTGCNLCVVGRDTLPYAWEIAKHYFKEIIDRNSGTATLEDVYAQLMRGEAILWVAELDGNIKMMMVTEIHSYPQGGALRIWLLAGEDMKLWTEGIAVVEAFGRANDCSFIEVFARRGLEKVLRDLGFESRYIWSLKKIDKKVH